MKLIVSFIVGLIAIALITLPLAAPFMWIWNYAVVQAVTWANAIGFWVAFWLLLPLVVVFYISLAMQTTKAAPEKRRIKPESPSL